MSLEVPTGKEARAHRVRALCGGVGRIEEGTYIVEGKGLISAMRVFSFPAEICDLVLEIQKLRGTPGIPMEPEKIEQREKLVLRLKAVTSAQLRNLWTRFQAT